ncbi:MAG: response regulator [Brevundimonas sp.]|uniref:response regulator n=1 Tax=Brevundimonas sp. TaxID=1871086 RepID=UPI00391A3780
MSPPALSERTLILAPRGRDADIARAILREAGLMAEICGDLAGLIAHMEAGAGVAVVADEGLRRADLTSLMRWLEDQAPWSDFPFILLTVRGGGIERNPAAQRASSLLGNVAFLERPFHPTTLVSAVQTALRGRRRQYEARERMEEIRRAEALLERRVQDRTAELESANRQLASQIVERERAESALRQAQRLEAIGQLTSGVAHDFNNLLTVVLGNVEQMQKRITDPALARRLEMMAEASRRGATLTAQMLAFSRRQKLELRPVDLNETVRGMQDLLASSIGGSVQIMPPDLAGDLWRAMIDPTQIELVILNLAINARDAMEVGGSLTIRTRNVTLDETQDDLPAGEFVMVSVTDTGSGMSEEVLAKAFEPFFTTKPVGQGSGLGLSQVFGLAKQAGGGVRIDSTVGEGTTIAVYLPRAENQTEMAGAPSARQAAQLGEQRRVLVVDDDDAVREVAAGYLDDLGYEVAEVGSGGAALEHLESGGEPAVVLMDFAMPGMNGRELAREIGKRRPGIPVVFVTGYADAEAFADTDPTTILHKPYTRSELAAALARCLEPAT